MSGVVCYLNLDNLEAAQKIWKQVALLSPSDPVSEARKRARFRYWHFSDLTGLADDVRCWEGERTSRVSIRTTQFDPERTLGLARQQPDVL